MLSPLGLTMVQADAKPVRADNGLGGGKRSAAPVIVTAHTIPKPQRGGTFTGDTFTNTVRHIQYQMPEEKISIHL